MPFQQTRPSVKDGEFGSKPKRALSRTESGNQSTGQEVNIKKVIWYTAVADLEGVRSNPLFHFHGEVQEILCKTGEANPLFYI